MIFLLSHSLLDAMKKISLIVIFINFHLSSRRDEETFFIFSVFSHKMFTFPWLFSLFIIISFLNWKFLSHVLWWILLAVLFCKFVIIICNSCIPSSSEFFGKRVIVDFRPPTLIHSGEICVMSMLLMFRVCHNSQYNSYQSCPSLWKPKSAAIVLPCSMSSSCGLIIFQFSYATRRITEREISGINAFYYQFDCSKASHWLSNNFIASSSSASLYSSGCQFGGGFGIMKLLLCVCCWCTFIICWLFNVFSNVFSA